MNHIPQQHPILVVAGPTASGKSALALALAERFQGTVINADSMQVYRDLRILTARPGPDDEARAPHRLYGILDGAARGSVAWWRDMALQAIADTIASGRLPILVGGTGMYLRSLFDGLAQVPPVPARLRAEVRTRAAAEGNAGLHAWLGQLDPEGAERLRPGDGQRLARALEVILATGRPLRLWQADAQDPGLPNPVAWILLQPPRGPLYERINSRFRGMLAAGALEEARAVSRRDDLPADAPMLKAHGLPELRRHLAGEISLDEACRIAQANTRHYAKRQTTWFRHQVEADYIEESDLGAKENFNLEAKIFPFIVTYLLTAGAAGV